MTSRFKTSGGGGHPPSVVSIKCGVCGATETLKTKAGVRSHLPAEAIEQSFRNKGWVIGSRPAKDRCPDHAKPDRKPKPQPEEAPQLASDPKITELKSPAPGASELPPREMSREHRRLIFLKLEDVYVDEKIGYATGWNDQKVADDMAVPRAWVELIREENFGPIKADQSPEVQGIKLAIEESERVLANASRDLVAVMRETKEIATKQTQLTAAIEGVTTILTKARAELAKLTGAR